MTIYIIYYYSHTPGLDARPTIQPKKRCAPNELATFAAPRPLKNSSLLKFNKSIYSHVEIRQISFGTTYNSLARVILSWFGTTYNSLAFGQGYLQMMKLDKLALAQRITLWPGLYSNDEIRQISFGTTYKSLARVNYLQIDEIRQITFGTTWGLSSNDASSQPWAGYMD